MMCIHCTAVTEVSDPQEKKTCQGCGRDGLLLLAPGQTVEEALVELKDRAKGIAIDSDQFFDEKGKFISKFLGEEILARYTMKTFMDTDEVYFYYKGTYRPARALVKAAAQNWLGERTCSKRVSEAYDYVRHGTYIERKDMEPPINIIALKNGLFNLDSNQLEPFSEKYFFLNTLPVVYDPAADCPEFKKFLSEVVEPDEVEIIFECFAYTLYRAYPIQQAVVFYGNGANGKSVLLHALKMFLGRENISGVPLQALGNNRFSSARLFQKLVNIDSDLSPKMLSDTTCFKRATGEDPVSGEKKNQDGFDFDNYAKFFFAANKLPKSPDDTDAFFRRWFIIPFEKYFDEQHRDPDKKHKISTPSELSGILNEALKRLKPLLARNHFSTTKSIENLRNDYLEIADPVRIFAEMYLEKDATGYAVKDDMFVAYGQFCNEKDIVEPMARNAFFRKISDMIPTARNGERGSGKSKVKVLNGIRLKGVTPSNSDGGQLTL